MSKNFKQRFLDGELIYSFEEELEQAVEDWHEVHIGPESLQDYLGFTEKEYQVFTSKPSIFENFLLTNGTN